MDFENMNIWCWLIPLLVGAICGLLGYFWGRGNAKTLDNAEELRALESKNAKLQADLEACLKKTTAAPKKHQPKPQARPKQPLHWPLQPLMQALQKPPSAKESKKMTLKLLRESDPKSKGCFITKG